MKHSNTPFDKEDKLILYKCPKCSMYRVKLVYSSAWYACFNIDCDYTYPNKEIPQ